LSAGLPDLGRPVEHVRELDVLALQEVLFDDEGNSSMLDSFSAQTELRYVYSRKLSPSMLDPTLHSGLAIVSRVPLRPITFSTLPNPDLSVMSDSGEIRTFDKGLVAATVALSGHDLTVASLHSFPFHRFGRDASDPEFTPIWESLAEDIERLPGTHLAIGGDFNTEFRDLVLSRTKRELRGTFTGIATHRTNKFDDILRSPELIVHAEPIALETFSDHRLCVVELGWNQWT
jgi:endonuclease/exonuclease/phosphatase family metal-dependent hydrolase